MSIVIQPKRILVTDFYSDEDRNKFIKMNTIIDLGMYFEVVKNWVALYETEWNGQPCLAIPRRFPMGLLHRFTNTTDVERSKRQVRFQSREITNTTEPRNKEQSKILDFMLGRNSYSSIAKKQRRALFSETGSGKTYTTLKAIAEENHFTFINCPDEKAITTWKQEIAKFTDIKPEEIGFLKGRESIPKLIKNRDKYKIVLGSSKTFSALIISNDHPVIEEFFSEMEFSLIAHDEVHLNIIVVFFIEMISEAKRTYYLSATPGRRIYREAVLLGNLLPAPDCCYFSPIVPRYELRLCMYYSNPTMPEHVKGLNAPRGFNYVAYGKNMLLNDKLPYMKPFLSDVLLKTFKAARKALADKDTHKVAIVCKTKEENNTLYNFFSKWAEENDPTLTIGLYNSDIEDADVRHEQTNAKLIITTDKSFAGIVNIVDLSAIILLYPISSEEHLLQIAGRIRRAEGKRSLVYILADGSFKRCIKNMRSAKSNLSDHCIDIKEITLNENKDENVVTID